ncbi:MAG: aminomethyl-transferring glycine dehydrogenase [Bacteroidetes bacterium]|nr:aminomethyl-transferring glycine dehydrogenase [Bacteroidota bacterium]
MITNNFIKRHNGPRPEEAERMLKKIGASSMDELIDMTVPQTIRTQFPLNLPKGMNEYQYLNHLKEIGAKNKLFKSFIGLGYYNTVTPGVIKRNILENPGWYTSYTPYQAEISQGRLEALLVFQTMISDMTGMPVSNCSLLDEGTSAAEAMIMAYNARSRDAVKRNVNKFFVSNELFPQTIDVLKTRSGPLGIELIFGDHRHVEFNEAFFGAIVQYPSERGNVHNYSTFVEHAHQAGALVIVAADILSLALLKPPAEWNADIVVGSAQRFGVPLGYGGPHAGFLAAKEDFKRYMPGRIIGISVDVKGNKALRMALQTREQHIKRERATSNICTAQALLASMAGMYAVYHGPDGIREIAEHIHLLTGILAAEITKYGYKNLNDSFFDTLEIEAPANSSIEKIRSLALEAGMNFRYIDNSRFAISLDETTESDDINRILNILAGANHIPYNPIDTIIENYKKINNIPENLVRTSEYLTHPVFNSYHSETEMMRYLKKLENKDMALNRTMIPLGSCTMKLNAAAAMFYLSWPEFGDIHPFVPENQAQGYLWLIREMEKIFCEITGFKAMSFQPNSGAAGEYTGLMVIRAYHRSRGEGHRKVCLIPSSAHGTNPASAHMAGMDIIVVKCAENGNIDTQDLIEKTGQHKHDLAALMVTYPSTHGIFEENIPDIIRIVHENGGQVYMDGANMNAQVGLTNPAIIGADVCHLNLHKTFGIPHGGGGPGVGPIGVAEHLVDFLPSHSIIPTGERKGITAVASAPYGSASVLPISYGYVKLLGAEGLVEATKYAILNANYLLFCLKDHYKILYTGKNGTCAHEMILDCNEFSRSAGIEVISIAKRLMDFGFHAPTVAFPVHGTLMVEPTESEPLSELDRFVEAMITIRQEIQEIIDGRADKDNNVLKNAPHTQEMVMADEWNYPYSRQKAAFPVPTDDKFWPPITRIDDAFGDRNLVCKC